MCANVNCDGEHSLIRLAFLSLMLCLAQVARGDGLPELVERIRPSIVAIGAVYPPRQPTGGRDPVVYHGTGFVVGDGRHVVTNAHVVPDALDVDNNQILAVFTGRGARARVRPATEVHRDDTRDLALLRFDGEPVPALELGESDRVREGQAVAFTGFPIGNVLGLYPATHHGIVAAITPIARPLENARDLEDVHIRLLRESFNVFQLNATAYPGNSGSPLFELETGRVIGVINSVMVKESRESMLSQPTGITFAIPAEYVHRLLETP